MSTQPVQHSIRRSILVGLSLLVIAVLALAALMSPLLVRFMEPSLEVGQVASQDILAPNAITYSSEVMTVQRRDAAARSVPPIYTRPDTSVARKQLESLRSALAYITSVRADLYATVQQKLDDLAALENIHLSQETASSILALNDARWQTIQQESIVVLEQVMRSTIRSDTIDETRNTLPALVSLSLPESQAAIVAELAAAFVAPNSFYSESLTETAREEARQAVEPVNRSFVAGETVVSRGRVLTAVDVEALQELGLAKPQQRWQDPASAGVLVLLLLAFMVFYIRRQPALALQGRSLVMIAMLFIVFLFAARLAISGNTFIPYALPVPAFSLVVAALFGAELALVSGIPLAIMVAYGLPNALDLTLYFFIGSLFGVLTLGRARRVASFFWAGLVTSLSGMMVILVYRLPEPALDWFGLAALGGAALFSGLASASLTIVLQFILAHFLGIATPLQLMELTRPDHPLLQIILREAPGTYQHSLQVANLAEQAAESIGADPLLTRVGALYHDVGKALNPIFFIENQLPGFINPHDDLDPATSAETIIRHVTDGLDLARKYRLPRRIMDFISEHHGTMVTRYQYVKAVTANGGDESQVDENQFRYPGPRPQSRETAVLMLADGCEARVRAEHPKDEDELHEVIRSVISTRITMRELDDTDLTLHDLDSILNSFAATLRGIYHPRLAYPKLEAAANVDVDTVPALASASRQSSDVPVGQVVDPSSSTS